MIFYKANYKPKKIFGDMKKRKIKDIPDINLYMWFPLSTIFNGR